MEEKNLVQENCGNEILDELCNYPKKKKNKKFIIFGASITALLSAAIVCAFLLTDTPKTDAPASIMSEDTTVSATKNETFAREVMTLQDESMLELYAFLLQGRHTASDVVNGTTSFNFETDGSFKGHSSKEENDFGSYTLTCSDGYIYVNIYCQDFIDRYEVDFSDPERIVLVSENGTYELY